MENTVMSRYSRQLFRIKHFIIIVIAGILLGAIMVLLFPQLFSKKPPEVFYLRSQYLAAAIPADFELLFWKSYKPESTALTTSIDDFPGFFGDTLTTGYPDICVFTSVYLETQKNENSENNEPVIPGSFISVFNKSGLFVIKESVSRFSAQHSAPFHLIWSIAKPRLSAGKQSIGESGLFRTDEVSYPYYVLDLAIENGSLLLFVLDFSSINEFAELGKLLTELKEDIVAAFAQGKSVIIAGDWNLCLPGTQNCSGTAETLPVLWTPEGWNWYYPLNEDDDALYALPYRDAFTGVLTSPDLDIIEFTTLTPDATQIQNNGVSCGSAVLLKIHKR
jgi:hypothetical protein